MVAIDPKGMKVLWRVNLTGNPNHLMTSPDGKLVYITIVDRGRVDVVDVAKRSVVDSIAVGTGPHDRSLRLKCGLDPPNRNRMRMDPAALPGRGTSAYVALRSASRRSPDV